MMMKNKMIRALGLSAVAVGLNVGVANAGQVTGNASVTVLSTVTVSEDSPLDFGTIAAFADADTAATIAQASLTINADGSPTFPANSARAKIVVIAAGTPGIYSITGAAPNISMTVAVSGAALLTDPSGFSTRTFTFATNAPFYTTNGPNNSTSSQTDTAGDLVFQVGGTITTTPTGFTTGTGTAFQNLIYPDATYTGTYTVDVNY